MSRPAEHYVHGPGVLVPARVAHALDTHLATLRNRSLNDPDVANVLQALHIAATRWATSARGSQPLPIPEATPRSGLLTTEQAARRLNVSSRQVINLLAGGRLTGELESGRWRITSESLAHHQQMKEAS